MAVFLLDTNVIIDALNGKKNRAAFLLGLTEQGHILACCPVSVSEIYAGVRPKEEQRTAALLHSLQFFPVTFPGSPNRQGGSDKPIAARAEP